MSNHLTLQKNEKQRSLADRYLSKQPITWSPGKEAWMIKKGKWEDVSVTYYRNGKILLQGKGLSALLQKMDIINQPPQTPAGGIVAKKQYNIIGADESGKGDYFGPLVTAAVYLPCAIESELRELGVRDSKALSPKKIDSLALKIMESAPYAVEILLPYDYNIEYERVGNLNTLLANQHAKTIAKLMGHQPEAVVVDQFAAKRVLEKAMQLPCPLIQETKGESKYLAVAAASIIARWHFLQAMEDLGALYRPLPRGATNVKPTARELVREFGPDILKNVAKMHFKTTTEVLQSL